MDNQSYTTSFSVEQSPAEVFNAVTNMRGWWSEEIEGDTDKLGAIFSYHFADAHRSKMKLIELIPNKRVVWLVVENYFNFTKDATEWTNTELVFDISEKEGKTELTFTHKGLVPEYECFSICSNAWGTYINGSLRNLIVTGKGEPNSRTEARTETEEQIIASQDK